MADKQVRPTDDPDAAERQAAKQERPSERPDPRSDSVEEQDG